MKRVISLDNLKMESINQKYIISKTTGRLILSSRYRNFKKLLKESCVPFDEGGPYSIILHMETYLDIDNILKCVIDALGDIINNDRFVYELHAFKKPLRKGALGRLDVYIDSMATKCNEVFKLQDSK